MNSTILAIINPIISAAVGAIVAAIITKARSLSTEQKAIRDAMRSLLKAELFDLHHRYIELDESLDAMGLQLASQCYEVYHDRLGGNGLGTRLYEEIEQKGISA